MSYALQEMSSMRHLGQHLGQHLGHHHLQQQQQQQQQHQQQLQQDIARTSLPELCGRPLSASGADMHLAAQLRVANQHQQQQLPPLMNTPVPTATTDSDAMHPVKTEVDQSTSSYSDKIGTPIYTL